MRIAVFGGSFNPPHNGHLNLAEKVYRNGYADRLILIPAFRPPHKPESPLTEYRHRLAMTQLAVAGCPWAEVSAIESLRPELPSYTFDTMCQLQQQHPEDCLVLLIGADSLMTLHTWHRAAELIDNWPLLTYPRPGARIEVAELRQHWPEAAAERLASQVIPLPESPLAATDIRAALHAGKDVSGQLSPGVAEYIRKNRLYR